jgi:hypothetical protein
MRTKDLENLSTKQNKKIVTFIKILPFHSLKKKESNTIQTKFMMRITVYSEKLSKSGKNLEKIERRHRRWE